MRMLKALLKASAVAGLVFALAWIRQPADRSSARTGHREMPARHVVVLFGGWCSDRCLRGVQFRAPIHRGRWKFHM
jgi:hypothetical protein